jgi:tRNA threonylcarbamoyladenosine modification (KEOPS) complex  Pcc1 subunit
MKASCDIVIEFDDAEKVKKILKSIEVDNFDFVKSQAKGKRLEAHIESKSVSSLIHTLDDYLACVSVAKEVVDKH